MSVDDYLTVADVARELGLDVPAAAMLVRTVVPRGTVRVGAGDMRVPADALEQLRAAQA